MDKGREFREQTLKQRHSNYMLYMRRMMKEIAKCLDQEKRNESVRSQWL